MGSVRLQNALVVGILTALLMAIGSWNGVAAAENGQSKTVGGLTVYLGVVPAEIVKGPLPHSAERPMHDRILKGSYQYHLVAAIFDTATGARIPDATVTAQVSGLGLAGPQKKLERMELANTMTYGAFFNLPGRDLYWIKLTIQRLGERQPQSLQFKYDHRS